MRCPDRNCDRSLSETLEEFSAYCMGESTAKDIEGQESVLHATNHCGVRYDVTLSWPGANAISNVGGLAISLVNTEERLADNPSRSCSHVAVLSDGGALRTMVPGQDARIGPTTYCWGRTLM